MIYFDNAATGGRKPDCVLSATAAALKVCANPGRSGHKLALSAGKIVRNCRRVLNDFFDGYDDERVIFTKNCTEALNIALFGVLKPGDHVVVSAMEHNSVLRPLERLKAQGVIEYDVCPLQGEGDNMNIAPESVASLIKPNTRLVAVTTASNVSGAMPPLFAIRRAIPSNMLLLCDGAQGAGHIPIRMQEAGIDILTLAGHKGLMGIQGSGALLFSERVELSPLLYGGTGSMSVSLEMPDFYPDALEAGTLSSPAIVSLLEGVQFLKMRLDKIAQRLTALTAYLLQGLKKLPKYTPLSLPNPCGIVAFYHQDVQAEYIASVLSSTFDIAVRGGLHCAPLMHQALGTGENGAVRVSFSHFNSQAEVDVLLDALSRLQSVNYLNEP